MRELAQSLAALLALVAAVFVLGLAILGAAKFIMWAV